MRLLSPDLYTLLEVRVLTERYRQTYNRVRPHSSVPFAYKYTEPA